MVGTAKKNTLDTVCARVVGNVNGGKVTRSKMMNDKQMLEQAIENSQEVVNRLKEQYREQYGYHVGFQEAAKEHLERNGQEINAFMAKLEQE